MKDTDFIIYIRIKFKFKIYKTIIVDLIYMYCRQFMQRGCEGLMKFYIRNPKGNKHEENNSLPYSALNYIIFQNLL